MKTLILRIWSFIIGLFTKKPVEIPPTRVERRAKKRSKDNITDAPVIVNGYPRGAKNLGGYPRLLGIEKGGRRRVYTKIGILLLTPRDPLCIKYGY